MLIGRIFAMAVLIKYVLSHKIYIVAVSASSASSGSQRQRVAKNGGRSVLYTQ